MEYDSLTSQTPPLSGDSLNSEDTSIEIQATMSENDAKLLANIRGLQHKANPQPLMREALTYPRGVIRALEGQGKSSEVFRLLNETATREKPVLFCFKSFALMSEQRKSWIKRFNLHADEIAICGMSKSEAAMEAYTNPDHPFMMHWRSRFIFMTQAAVQRNRHHSLISQDYPIGNPHYDPSKKLTKTFSHIIVDEFDFTNGIVPSFSYIMEEIRKSGKELSSTLQTEIRKWIGGNFTEYDVNRAQISEAGHTFALAYWIEGATCPITFLTSEQLATAFLETVGFKAISLPAQDFTDTVVHIWPSPLISRDFFSRMNANSQWGQLGFKTIISDMIASYYEGREEDLEISAIPHVSARGSNALIGQQILTILTHIPKSAIQQILDAFRSFGNHKYTYEQIEALFYRDRLCQSIGRVIGYRGISSGIRDTCVFCHSEIYNSVIKTLRDHANPAEYFPYSLKEWSPEWPGRDDTMTKVKEQADKKKEERKETKEKRAQFRKAVSFSELEKYFEPCADSQVSYADISEVINQYNIKSVCDRKLPVSKVVGHFAGEIILKKIDNKTARFAKGIKIK